MGWLSDIITDAISRNIISSKKERAIEQQNKEILRRQEIILKNMGYKVEQYKEPTDYISKGLILLGKTIIFLVCLLILLCIIAFKVM